MPERALPPYGLRTLEEAFPTGCFRVPEEAVPPYGLQTPEGAFPPHGFRAHGSGNVQPIREVGNRREILHFSFPGARKIDKKVLKPYCLSSFSAFCYSSITSTIYCDLPLTEPQHIGNLKERFNGKRSAFAPIFNLERGIGV